MSRRTNSPSQAPADAISGLVVLGVLITGAAGLLLALLAVFNDYDYVGAGLALLASATAFGLLANAVFRA